MSGYQVVYPKTRTTRDIRKRVVLDGPGKGFTTAPDGTEELYYETSLDLDALHLMARKAAGNAKWQSKDGPVRVRILARRKI